MSKRREFDFYPTSSEWIIQQLLNQFPEIGGKLLEPCSGNLDIVNVLKKERGIELVVSNDLDRGRDSEYHEDATKQTIYDTDDYDWIVTNPPFNQAMAILEKAHKNATRGVAFLLRLTFLEPTYERGRWLQENPPTGLIVLPRYSFTQDGKTDSVTCAWMIWDKQAERQEIHIVPRQEKK